MPITSYDFLAIGGGSAGFNAARVAASLGLKTAVVDGAHELGGLCILLGLFTRPAAFICSGMMAVAYWQFHAPNGIWPAQNHGMPAALLCFIFLYIAAEGGGPWSLDAQIRSKSLGAKS